ncbi:MAG: CHASE domain-containing protein [Hyphomicrobiaceae bacterium]
MPKLAPYLRAPLLVLALCLAATGLAAWSSRALMLSEASRTFALEAKNLRDAISDAMKAYSQVLRAGASFAAAVGEPTREQWQAFTEAQHFEASFPGIQGLGYAVVLAPGDIAGFEERERARGRPNFSVQPAGRRDKYAVITFLEPGDWRNLRAVGFDMFSDATRRKAMNRAELTGEPSLSGRVTLVQETAADPQPGVLMYLPVYGAKGQTRAFVYAAFRMSDLVGKVLKAQAPDSARLATAKIYDGAEATPAALLFDGTQQAAGTSSRDPKAAYAVSLPLAIAGTEWMMRVASTPAFERSVTTGRVFLVVLAGSLLSLLIAFIVGTITHTQMRMGVATESLAKEIAIRKQAEEAAGIANRELIHRAKNTFAVISAIASQTARHSTSVDDFMHDFRDRLNALARIQDLLRPDQQRATDLGQLIEVVLKPHVTNVEERLAVGGPAVPVPQNEALVFSLLINELATNATKYGAWSVPTGKVDLNWQVDRTASPPTLKLAWQESGGPAVEEPRRRGFGSSVMSFVVERSMNGTLQTDFAVTGIRHQFTVPWGVLQDV